MKQYVVKLTRFGVDCFEAECTEILTMLHRFWLRYAPVFLDLILQNRALRALSPHPKKYLPAPEFKLMSFRSGGGRSTTTPYLQLCEREPVWSIEYK